MSVPVGIHHFNGQLMTTATLTARLGAPGYPQGMSFHECAQWLDLKNWSEFMHLTGGTFPTTGGHVDKADAITYFTNSGWLTP